MKFVDEVEIIVQAGKGGSGCVSFRREKFIPFGGPDGGDGGDGGSIFLKASSSINTLVDFRHQRFFQAENGKPGMGNQRTGRGGEDLTIIVPIGTEIYIAEDNEKIGDLITEGQFLCVAKGGAHGLGNLRFKTSTNRAPEKSTPGYPGERKTLRLELKLLADVGLVGLPNAGKSSIVRSLSAATPKVADYPFTTLYPHLGVVKIGDYRSFVLADIPGLISGASEGLGLGIQFLRHISRCRILVHVVEISFLGVEHIVEQIRVIEQELINFDIDLVKKERWLVLNKADLLTSEEGEELLQKVKIELCWEQKIYLVSTFNKQGLKQLSLDLMTRLEDIAKPS